MLIVLCYGKKTANNCAGKLLFILSVEKNSKKKENGFAMFLHKKKEAMTTGLSQPLSIGF